MSDCECPEVKCPEGIPAWVMTFADLMSLLLAFFVLLFSFSEMDKNVYKEIAGSLKDAFGVQREIKAKESPRGINIIAREFSPGRPDPTPLNEIRQHTTDEHKLHPVFTDPSENGQENQDEKAKVDADDKEYNAMREEQLDEELARRLAKLNDEVLRKMLADAEEIKSELEEEINDGLIDVDVEDKRIVLRIQEKGSFPSGSAVIMRPFQAITDKIARVFAEFDGKIVVSGHTDNIPINTSRYRSNWELSASRSVSVIHALRTEEKLTDKRFHIEAFADTSPVADNDTFLGRAKNRRVEIKLDYGDDPSMVPILNKETGEYELRPMLQLQQEAEAAEPFTGQESAFVEDTMPWLGSEEAKSESDDSYFESVQKSFSGKE